MSPVYRAPSLIEAVRIRNGVAPLWYLHLRRLAASCQALGVPLPGELPTPSGGGDRVHRLEVSARGVEVTERPVGSTAGVSLVASGVVHQPYPHKTTDRGQFDRAMAEAKVAGADDAIMLNEGGYLTECAIWAVFWWEEGRLCAPPLGLGILPSVARARLEEVSGGISERRVRLEEIRGRGLFVANAVRGVLPVANLEGRAMAQDMGTPRLSASFWS